MKPTFIIGSFISMLFLNMSLILKHSPSLDQFDKRRPGFHLDKACAYLTILLSIAGSIGLMLLSYFDYMDYTTIHYTSLALFMCVLHDRDVSWLNPRPQHEVLIPRQLILFHQRIIAMDPFIP